jgi:hypothetical protein
MSKKEIQAKQDRIKKGLKVGISTMQTHPKKYTGRGCKKLSNYY